MGRVGRPVGAIQSLGSPRRELASSVFDFRASAALYRPWHRLLVGIRHLRGVMPTPTHFLEPAQVVLVLALLRDLLSWHLVGQLRPDLVLTLLIQVLSGVNFRVPYTVVDILSQPRTDRGRSDISQHLAWVMWHLRKGESFP